METTPTPAECARSPSNALASEQGSLEELLATIDEKLQLKGDAELAERIKQHVNSTKESANNESVNGIADMLSDKGYYDASDTVHAFLVLMLESTFGADHPEVATALSNRALVLQEMGKADDAEKLLVRALAIDKKHDSGDHADVAIDLTNLANALAAQQKFEEAIAHIERAIAFGEEASGPTSSDVGVRLNNLAGIYHKMGKLKDAFYTYKRALKIAIDSMGPYHPTVATRYNNIAGVLDDMGKRGHAIKFYRRALFILEKSNEGSTEMMRKTVKRNLDKIYPVKNVSAKRPRLEEKVEVGKRIFSIVPAQSTNEDVQVGLYRNILEGEEDKSSPQFREFQDMIGRMKEGNIHLSPVNMTISIHSKISGKYYVVSPLFVACALGKTRMVKRLMKLVSIEAADENGFTPIHYAVANGRLEIVKMLFGVEGEHAKDADISKSIFQRGKDRLDIMDFRAAVLNRDKKTLDRLVPFCDIPEESASDAAEDKIMDVLRRYSLLNHWTPESLLVNANENVVEQTSPKQKDVGDFHATLKEGTSNVSSSSSSNNESDTLKQAATKKGSDAPKVLSDDLSKVTIC